jgi:hypothetical protein
VLYLVVVLEPVVLGLLVLAVEVEVAPKEVVQVTAAQVDKLDMVDPAVAAVDVVTVQDNLMDRNVVVLVMMLLVVVVLAAVIGLVVVVEILVAISKVLAAAVEEEIMVILPNLEMPINQDTVVII